MPTTEAGGKEDEKVHTEEEKEEPPKGEDAGDKKDVLVEVKQIEELEPHQKV